MNFTTSSSTYDENGLCGEVCTLLAQKEGKYTLNYTFQEESPNGGINTFHGSIPIYVISKINQPLAALLNETNSLGLSLIPENISKANADKWFLPSLDIEAKDINGITINTSTNPLLKGRAYFVTKEILKNDVLLKNLDISSVTQSNFNRINDGTTFLIPQKGITPKPLVWVDQKNKVQVTFFDEISFEDAAAKYSMCPSGSRGGDLGYFRKGMMVKPFEDASFNGEIGKVSNPIQTQFGWHLIKVIDKK